MTTREKIEHWMKVFECQWNDEPVTLTVTQRELLGKLLLEECLETLTKGLGLVVVDSDGNALAGRDYEGGSYNFLTPTLDEGQAYDSVEFFDGLGDTAWVAYFNARVAGGNLDDVLDEIFRSNMSKLDDNGRPIHNGCNNYMTCELQLEGRGNECTNPDHFLNPNQPAGKILKGPNFRKPNIAFVIGLVK